MLELPVGDRAAGQREFVAGHASDMAAHAVAESLAGQLRRARVRQGRGVREAGLGRGWVAYRGAPAGRRAPDVFTLAWGGIRG